VRIFAEGRNRSDAATHGVFFQLQKKFSTQHLIEITIAIAIALYFAIAFIA